MTILVVVLLLAAITLRMGVPQHLHGLDHHVLCP